MSRLIFEGDTLERFGRKIPTPFIETIKIYEDDIHADISIYLHITDDNEINNSIYSDLSNLRLYAGFGIIYQEPDRLSLGTNFKLVDDSIYNSEGTRFAKFTYTRISSDKELEDFTFARAQSDSTNTETYYSCFIAISQDEEGSNNQGLHFFTEPNEFDKQGIYGVFRNVSSPLIYEKVLTAPIVTTSRGNRLATDPTIIYVDNLNIPCKETPLKSIQKNYHKTSMSFRQQIKTQVDNLTSNFDNTTNQQVQSFRDSISFITQTKFSDVDFLTELDSVRNSFPSRTSTSELGLLYNSFKNIIFAANDALIIEDRVKKEIVPNTKLIDLRGYFIAEDQEWSRRNADSYEPRVDDTGNILYPNVFMERQQLEISKQKTAASIFNKSEPVTIGDPGTGLQDPDYDITSIFGYFFFDYEKALHKKSNLSQIFEVQKLLNIWGNNSLDSYFGLKRAEMFKFSRTRLVRKIITPYEDNRPVTNLVLNLTDHQESIVKVVQEKTDENENSVIETDIPYVLLRGFDTVQGLGGYRLLAFEFQDFEEASVSFRRGGSYRYNVVLDDNTLDFYEELVKNYEQVLSELKDYQEKARDFCSYNNIDNRFNDFFAVGVKESYEGEDEYPWVRAPNLFAIHQDLVNNKFSGLAVRMSGYASNLTTIVSPENGTLPALENLVNDMEVFYEKYYGVEGEITKLISSRRDPDGNLVPSLRDNEEFAATLGFDDFPDVVDFTVDIEPPPKCKLWSGTQVFVQPNPVKFFINTRIATMAMARSKGDSYKEFVEREQEKNEGGAALVTLEALETVFDKNVLAGILGGGAAAGGATFGAAAASAGSALTSLGGATAGSALGVAAGGSATVSVGGIVGTASVGLGTGTASAGGAAGAAAAAGAIGVAGIAIGAAALVALITIMIISSTKRKRVRRITRFMNKFVARMQNEARPLTYEAKKALIQREFNFAFGDSDRRPDTYKDLTNNDKEFLRGEKARIGNIGLLTLVSTEQNVYDVSKWLSKKTRNIREKE